MNRLSSLAVASLLALPLRAADPASSSSPKSPSSPTSPTSPTSPSSPTTSGGRCAALVASDAWVRLLPPGTANTASFFRVKNTGAEDVVVVGASSPIAKRAGLHGMSTKDGVMRMFDVARVVVPAGGEVAFQPGGLHVMLFEQAAPKAGDAVPVTLACDDGSKATFAATAQAQAPQTTSNASPTASTNATTTTR